MLFIAESGEYVQEKHLVRFLEYFLINDKSKPVFKETISDPYFIVGKSPIFSNLNYRPFGLVTLACDQGFFFLVFAIPFPAVL